MSPTAFDPRRLSLLGLYVALCFAGAFYYVRRNEWHSSASAPPLHSYPPLDQYPRANDPSQTTVKHPRSAACSTLRNGRHLAPLESLTTSDAHPTAQIGSHAALHLDREQCMTYHGRFSPYLDKAIDSDFVTGLKRYVDDRPDQNPWKRASEGVAHVNRVSKSNVDWREEIDACRHAVGGAGAKQAVLVEVNAWTPDEVINLRSLVGELALVGGESDHGGRQPVDVYLLHNVIEESAQHAYLTSPREREQVLINEVPREFWNITILWSEKEMQLSYPGLEAKLLNAMTPWSAYRSCMMPVQTFSQHHPSYDFVYVVRPESRYLGDWADFFQGVEHYARCAAGTTGEDMEAYRFLHTARNVRIPPTNKCDGNEADLIAFDAIFDPQASDWYWKGDVQGYRDGDQTPRRATLSTLGRYSRSLLSAMSFANAEMKVSTHCTTFAPTIIHHSQNPALRPLSFSLPVREEHKRPFKAVTVPHPQYMSHDWDEEVLQTRLRETDMAARPHSNFMGESSAWAEGFEFSTELYRRWKEDEGVCRQQSLVRRVSTFHVA